MWRPIVRVSIPIWRIENRRRHYQLPTHALPQPGQDANRALMAIPRYLALIHIQANRLVLRSS